MRALHYDGDIPVVDSAVGGDGRLCEDERELLKTYRQLAVDGKAIEGTVIPCADGKHEVVVEM